MTWYRPSALFPLFVASCAVNLDLVESFGVQNNVHNALGRNRTSRNTIWSHRKVSPPTRASKPSLTSSMSTIPARERNACDFWIRYVGIDVTGSDLRLPLRITPTCFQLLISDDRNLAATALQELSDRTPLIAYPLIRQVGTDQLKSSWLINILIVFRSWFGLRSSAIRRIDRTVWINNCWRTCASTKLCWSSWAFLMIRYGWAVPIEALRNSPRIPNESFNVMLYEFCVGPLSRSRNGDGERIIR